MEKVIYLKNDNQKKDYCLGETYYDFLDYAFDNSDYFMLVYTNYYGKGYSKNQKYFKSALKPFIKKSRSNPSWPGTLKTFCPHTTYKIVFYKTAIEAKEILKKTYCLSDWSRPENPEDLAFFKGNQCWFYSVGHEKIAAIIHANENDVNFLINKGLASKDAAFVPQNDYFDAFDEPDLC